MENQNGNSNKFGKWFKTSITARMFIVGILTLILLIPLFFVQDLIRERAHRQESVVQEINDKWGAEVLIYGPLLKVPYRSFQQKSITDSKTKTVTTESVEVIKYAYFFPEELDINTTVDPEVKSLGIYNTAVYKSQTHLKGTFKKPDFSEIDLAESNIIWEKARFLIQTSNIKGVSEQMRIALNGKPYPFQATFSDNNTKRSQLVKMHHMESAPIGNINSLDTKNLDFAMDISVKGSSLLRFIPIGKTTAARMVSAWETNNFTGMYLPYNEDKKQEHGFDAQWKILDINRPFSQQFFDHLPNLQEYAFGVNFMIPVDEYQKSERTAKYGFLVIGLTFLIFFLIQTLSKINIHPFQYLMIGLSLVMFYTLLISISEHSSFLKAYLIASIAVIALITLYSKSILKNIKFPLFILASLSGLYGFIYVIIQLENYALLVGSIGLFAILATVMYASRKIDWEQG